MLVGSVACSMNQAQCLDRGIREGENIPENLLKSTENLVGNRKVLEFY